MHAFVILARNKAKHIEKTVRAAFAQTIPMDIVISDQGSEDGTMDIVKGLAHEYSGHHKITVLDCPHTEFKGMAGMNAHFNWLRTVLDHDLWIISSGDDLPYPERSRRTVEIFEKHQPSVILTSIGFVNPDGEVTGYTAHPQASRFVRSPEIVRDRIGGSTSHAWSKDFVNWMGDLPHIVIGDVYPAVLGAFRHGTYCIVERLHDYVRHADPENTGLEGVLRSAKSEAETMAIAELMHFHQFVTVRELIRELEAREIQDEQTMMALGDNLAMHAFNWSQARLKMTMERVQPRMMNV